MVRTQTKAFWTSQYKEISRQWNQRITKDRTMPKKTDITVRDCKGTYLLNDVFIETDRNIAKKEEGNTLK
jgi:hypothetical protein